MFNSTFIGLEQKSRENIPRNPGDYVGDGSKYLYIDGKVSRDNEGQPLTDEGLIYCGKCHQLKSYRFFNPLIGRVQEPFVLCKCEQMIDSRERDRIIEYNRQIKVDKALKNADRLMLQNTFKKDNMANSETSKLCRDYCYKWLEKYQPKNIGLYLYGDVGTGKTFYASCIANEIAKVYQSTVKMISVTRLINDLFSATDKNSYIDNLINVDLLILDDLGAEGGTDYRIEQVFNLIDERYKALKPLIVTSNIDYGKLKAKTDIKHKRIYDRIIDMCVPVKVGGDSMRKPPDVRTQSVYQVDTASFDVSKFEDGSIF